MRAALIVTASFGFSLASAQITLLNTGTSSLRSVLSLQAGPKLMDAGFGQFSSMTIYNLDLSVHRVLTIPPFPSGYTWYGLNYITEALFDDDPSTIEFMINAYNSGANVYMVKVFREDGSEVFSMVPGMTQGFIGGTPLDVGPAIFETGSGAVMLVQEGDGTPTMIYSLPGHVPCVDMCYESAFEAATLAVDDRSTVGGGELVILNQGSADVVIQYTLPQVASSGLLRVVDAEGRLVRSEDVRSQGTLRLGTSDFAAGVYQVSIEPDQGARFGTRLLIVR